MSEAEILVGDVRERIHSVTSESIQTCITSPPYFGLRDYGHGEDQIGLETSPDAYVKELVQVFSEVRRVLSDDGTLWLNLGDSYAGSWGNYGGKNRGAAGNQRIIRNGSRVPNPAYEGLEGYRPAASRKMEGIKPKDLLGIPWRVAFALQADGWYLRSDIIWAKPNPMPESVTDRPTKSHEYLFLLSKSERYLCDMSKIAEPASTVGTREDSWKGSRFDIGKTADHQLGRAQTIAGRSRNASRLSALERGAPNEGVDGSVPWEGMTRNKRDVWFIGTQPFKGAHFAVMPEALVEPCVLAGSRENDWVLDPFAGSGTVGVVALRHQRNFTGIELNPEYAQMARNRIVDDGPLLNSCEMLA
jgi:DNA modification methylase